MHEAFCSILLNVYTFVYPIVERSPVRNIRVYNPTTNTLNVRWEPASGDVQEYRVVYSPQSGTRPSQSVSQNVSHTVYSMFFL